MNACPPDAREDGRSFELAPEPASAGAARRAVRDALVDWGFEELVDTATLLVSEVVTNVVLHAATVMQVSVQRSGGGLRIAVQDSSNRMPSRRHYDPQSLTGRGLGMLELLAQDWGVEAVAGGKSVWFRLGDAVSAPSAAVGPEAPGLAAAPTITIRLLRMPAALVDATVQYGDALHRDAALLALGGDLPGDDAAAWQSPKLDLTAVIELAREALGRGDRHIDVDVAMAETAPNDAVHRLGLIDEADRLAVEGALLLPPSLPEVAACRRWLLGEIVHQARGDAPTPWEMPDPAIASSPHLALPPEEFAALARADVATIVADESNHILGVNPAAAAMLGWTEAEITGQRLMVIVPPELREAHLAGYTRYALTGEPRLLGRPVRVPALRADGDRVEVELFIEGRRVNGRSLFTATLQLVD